MTSRSGHPQQAAASHSEPRRATAGHCEPRPATASRGQPLRPTAGRGQPLRAAAVGETTGPLSARLRTTCTVPPISKTPALQLSKHCSKTPSAIPEGPFWNSVALQPFSQKSRTRASRSHVSPAFSWPITANVEYRICAGVLALAPGLCMGQFLSLDRPTGLSCWSRQDGWRAGPCRLLSNTVKLSHPQLLQDTRLQSLNRSFSGHGTGSSVTLLVKCLAIIMSRARLRVSCQKLMQCVVGLSLLFPRVSFLAMSTVFGSYPANEYWLTVRWIPEFRV